MSPSTPKMVPSSDGIHFDKLKLVKNASLFQEQGIFFIRHYETIIFAYKPESKTAEINWHCSTTSDRQIRNALSFFCDENSTLIDVSDGSQKWRYSGEFQN